MARLSSRGSITAELVLALPTVAILIAIAVWAVGLQVLRMDLINTASLVARSIALGEDSSITDRLLSKIEGVRFEVFEGEELVCVALSASPTLAGQSWLKIELREEQCAKIVLN